MKIKKVNLVSDVEWDKLVTEVYGKPYCFQQQDGCRYRGVYHFSVPNAFIASNIDLEMNHFAPNDSEMSHFSPDDDNFGVAFDSWLMQPVTENTRWWYRKFYPALEPLAQDLYEKGLLEAGDYIIEVD